MFYVPSEPGKNRGERLGEFESRSVKTFDYVSGFHLLENSYKNLPRFSTGYGSTENMFYFYYKIIIFIVKKRKTIYEVLTVNYHNS